MDIKKKIIFPVVSTFFGMIMAFSIAELSSRVLGIGYGNIPLESHNIFHHVHPAEYRFVSYTPSGEYGGHEIYYNADRLVANPSAIHPKNKKTNCVVVFLGDSFTEAGQVEYKNSFVGILENHSDCAIKNYGVSSYSPIFYLLQWRRLIKQLKPTLVVVQLSSNDISTDQQLMKIAKKNQNGEVMAIPGPGRNWQTRQLRKSYFLRFLRRGQLQILWNYENRGRKHLVVAGYAEENPNISGLSAEFVKTLAQEVQDSGTQFVLTAVPSKFRIVKKLFDHQELNFSNKWKLFANENNIPFLDLTPPFEKAAQDGIQPFFKRDIHFNENGHFVIASELSQTYPHLFEPVNIPSVQ